MNKRRKKKATAKRDAWMDETLAVLGGQSHRLKRRPRLTWREKLLTDTVDSRGPKAK